jgi:hypothetical protein
VVGRQLVIRVPNSFGLAAFSTFCGEEFPPASEMLFWLCWLGGSDTSTSTKSLGRQEQ